MKREEGEFGRVMTRPITPQIHDYLRLRLLMKRNTSLAILAVKKKTLYLLDINPWRKKNRAWVPRLCDSSDGMLH